MAQTVPYLTEQQIRNNYAKALTDYTNQRNAEADRARTQVNSNFDNTQRQNYVQYMQNQRELPEQLARMGVTGGASETSALRAKTNYENNFNNTERSRGTEIGNINNALADQLNTYRMTADQNMNDEIAQNRQLRANYEKQLQQEAEQRFANTISGYDSISGIDNEIAKISRSGVDTWRIPYLRARRAELVAAGLAASGGSYGGGGGYSGYSGYTYSNNDSGDGGSTGITREQAMDAVRARLGATGSGSSTKSSKSMVKGKASGVKTRSGTKRYYENRKSGASYRNSKKSSDYSWRRR